MEEVGAPDHPELYSSDMNPAVDTAAGDAEVRRRREEEREYHERTTMKLSSHDQPERKPFPSERELDNIIAGFFRASTYAAESEIKKDDIKEIGDLLEKGLDITKKLLGGDDDEGPDWEKYFGYLSKAFTGGKAVWAAYKFVSEFGKPSEFQKLMAKLGEITAQLKSIESTIQQGFAELMAHIDFTTFRSEVASPTQILFDEYIACHTVLSLKSIQDLKRDCGDKYPPNHILSILYTYLTTQNNIFMTQLKANKYQYSTYKTWLDTIYHHATRLITVSVYHYGILTEEAEGDLKKNLEAAAKDHMKSMFTHLERIHNRLQEIELDRLKLFHTGGFAAEFLQKEFDKVKLPTPDFAKELSPDFLSKIVFKIKQNWKQFNGPTDFYLALFRGNSALNNKGQCRLAAWHIGDPERVTVAGNIGYRKENGFEARYDGVCIALIQPLNAKLLEAHKKGVKDNTDKVMKIVKDNLNEDHFPHRFLEKTSGELQKLKPLLLVNNSDYNDRDHYRQAPDTVTYAYKMLGEAWSSPGGPEPLKIEWYGWFPDWILRTRCKGSARRMLNVYFQ